jgi:hypothetical protein
MPTTSKLSEPKTVVIAEQAERAYEQLSGNGAHEDHAAGCASA